MLQYNPSISGSLSVTGSLIVTNGVIGTVNGVDIQIFSSSISQVVTNIQTTTGSQSGRLTSIESFTSSLSTTNTFTSSTSARLSSIETISASNLSRLNAVETITASNVARLNSIEIVSASNIARINSLETTSASVNTLNTEQNTRLTNLEIRTGSLATTGSNTFIGTQTITGSLFISANLVVQGTSSLQNITASAVSIGTNIINLNTANPAIRYAGLVIGDSGSIGSSGSFFYDSVQDEMIFIHRGANTTVTSSVTLMGPQTYDNVGNETYPTSNIIQKGTGNEHLADSCIFDNGTTTCIKNNLVGTGTACFGGTITSAGDIVTPTRIAADTYNGYTGGSTPLTIQTGGAQSVILGTNTCARLTITSTGVANFSCRICSPGALLTNDLQINGTSSGKIVGFSNYSNSNVGLSLYNTAGTEVIYLNANNGGIGSTSVSSTYFSGTCLTLNGFSSGNGFKMDYGSASGQITAINLIANGTTNGFIGIQMVDGSNGDLWLGSSANRSMTIYRTGNHGFGTTTPCTTVHVNAGYGARFGCGNCFYGGGYAGGGFPYGDEFGNGAAYTYQTANTTATNPSLFGGYAAGYFKGGPGSAYGGGGAGIIAIGGDGANSESVNSGGGAGLFARGGKNGAGSVHSYAGWFDGGDVMVRCGNAYFCGSTLGIMGLGTKVHEGTYHVFTGASCVLTLPTNYGSAASIYLFGSLLGNDSMHYAHMMYYYRNDFSGFVGATITQMSCYNVSTAGQRYTFSIVDPGGLGKSGCPLQINITCANGPSVGAGSYCTRFKIVVYNVY